MDGNTNEENSPLEAKPPMKRMSSFEIDKPLISSNESDGEKKEISVVNVMAPQTQEYDSRYLSLKQFSITLTKNITGPGVLSIPYSMLQMGIPATFFFYIVLAVINVWCSHLLVDVNDYTHRNPSPYPYKRIGNDYAVIIYHILGPRGYYLFLVLYLIAIWGVQVSTLITIVDFIDNLPWLSSIFPNRSTTKLFLHITCTLICMLLVFMKDMKPLVPVSSLSILALLISFILLLAYGFASFHITFSLSMLKPLSWTALLSSMGVASFSLGYNFSFLSFFKQVKPSLKNQTKKALTPIIAVITICLLLFPLLALMSFYSSPAGIKQDILLSIPETHPISIIISIMMFLSCLFTYPIYSPPLNEILEETVKNKKSVGIFVADSTRLTYRILQTIGISIVAYICPFFGDIISLDILCCCRSVLNGTRWIRVHRHFNGDPSAASFYLFQELALDQGQMRSHSCYCLQLCVHARVNSLLYSSSDPQHRKIEVPPFQ
ncbi:hypothetical protein WA556_002612, partial [Blastocystis sp. ATCC 50177/Nand II]